jgi:hypothetical protein
LTGGIFKKEFTKGTIDRKMIRLINYLSISFLFFNLYFSNGKINYFFPPFPDIDIDIDGKKVF